MKKIALIIPVHNEEASIVSNLAEIQAYTHTIANIHFDFFIIDDGSTDNTLQLLTKQIKNNSTLKLICLNRNFGKESAILAGLSHALSYDAAIIMDSDLQHPPSLIPTMVKYWQQNLDVVEAVKIIRNKETLIKKLLTHIFYYLFNIFTDLNIKNQTDFKLLSNKVIKEYCQLTEHKLFFRGLIKWMNYPTAQIPFDVPERQVGKSSWSRFRLVQYALSSITSFTSLPLHVITLLGGITFVIGLVIGGIALFDKISGVAVDGFTTVIILLLTISSILMLSIGLIGVYIAKIYDEIKARPKYIINHQQSKLNSYNKSITSDD